MPTAYKVLGQAALVDTTLVDLYTVPTAKQAITSSIMIVNRSTTSTTISIAVRPAGAAIASKHWIAYNVTLDPQDMLTLTVGISLNAGDVLSASTLAGSQLSISVFGAEIS